MFSPVPLFAWQVCLLLAICGLLASVWPVPAGILALLIITFDKRFWRPLPFVVAGMIFCAAWLYLGQEAVEWHESARAPEWLASGSRYQQVCGRVERATGQPGGALRVILSDVSNNADSAPLRGLCQLTWVGQETAPLPGQRVCVRARPVPVRDFANENFTALETSWFASGVRWRVYAKGTQARIYGEPARGAALREKLRRSFVDLLHLKPDEPSASAQARAILPALLFGDRQYLSRKTQDLFAAATLAHSLALSGQHLCLAGLLGLFVAVTLGRAHPAIQLLIPRRHLILLASWPFACCYLWLGNAPHSLVRAFAMLSLASLWLVRRRAFTGLDVLLASLLIIIAASPASVFDVGLQLSALCVAAIILSAPLQKQILGKIQVRQPILRKCLIFLAAIFLTSLFIQLALLPVSVARFANAGFWFPLNVVWLPVLGAVTLPFSAVALILAQLPFAAAHAAASACVRVAASPPALLLQLLEWLDAHDLLSGIAYMRPYWAVFIAFALLSLLLPLVFASGPKMKRRGASMALLCLLFLALAPLDRLARALDKDVSVAAIDVGQGDAFLIRFGGGRLLLDGGGNAFGNLDPGKRVLEPLLMQNDSPDLAAMANSHPDTDHMGGLLHLARSFRVGRIFHNGREAEGRLAAEWHEMKTDSRSVQLYRGDMVFLGDTGLDLRLEVLHPPRPGTIAPAREWTDNDASLVMRLMQGTTPLALFCGDAGLPALKKIPRSRLQAPLLFAPHHGSSKNFYPGFYTAVEPSLVAASCGYNNRWKFPGKRLCTYLRNRNIPLFTTSENGKLEFRFAEDGKPRVTVAR